MKMLSLSLCLLITVQGWSRQTQIEKTIPYTPGKTIEFKFDDAKEVNIRGWDESSIQLSAQVLINMGANDDAFKLDVNAEPDGTSVVGYIKNKEGLPQMLVIRKNGQDYYFKGSSFDSPEVQKFLAENGKDGYDWMSNGVAREIVVTVFVPRDASVAVTSKHGILDIEEFQGSLRADSKHGGVDMEISESSTNKFLMATQWGAIYTDVNFSYDRKEIGQEHNRWTNVEASLNGGKGSVIDIQSKHGNLYLRKQ